MQRDLASDTPAHADNPVFAPTKHRFDQSVAHRPA
jgi:hypothetical protein